MIMNSMTLARVIITATMLLDVSVVIYFTAQSDGKKRWDCEHSCCNPQASFTHQAMYGGLGQSNLTH